MKDDRIFVKEWHRQVARATFERIQGLIGEKYTVAVGGESGSGKSETAVALKEVLEEHGIATGILQADDYFIYMSHVCDSLRRQCLDLVGPGEVKLDFIDCHLHSFKAGAPELYKPVAVYQEARFEREIMPVADLRVLIAEGTFCTLLELPDLKIFIDRDFRDTLADRKARARDMMDEFTEKILEIEHGFLVDQREQVDILASMEGTIRVLSERVPSP